MCSLLSPSTSHSLAPYSKAYLLDSNVAYLSESNSAYLSTLLFLLPGAEFHSKVVKTHEFMAVCAGLVCMHACMPACMCVLSSNYVNFMAIYAMY